MTDKRINDIVMSGMKVLAASHPKLLDVMVAYNYFLTGIPTKEGDVILLIDLTKVNDSRDTFKSYCESSFESYKRFMNSCIEWGTEGYYC